MTGVLLFATKVSDIGRPRPRAPYEIEDRVLLQILGSADRARRAGAPRYTEASDAAVSEKEKIPILSGNE
jgi:hypothetical protein